MNVRLVDVIDGRGNVLHTYPITLGESSDGAEDSAYEAKALQAAAQGRLVPDAALGTLTARMHTGRGGQMAPYGDDLQTDSETKFGLDQAVRERAYLLWERDGSPDGRGDEYWHRALDQHLRDRAYVLWQQAGSPEGQKDEYWHRLVAFQSH
ncbi:DUF2934 domain-containing protein [Burkholderia sp. 9120]|uniref:DUF2934 domain-containing protein n=1 Tax=Burkholderia sp. 9120 TaxID=1500897 RepID=UPI000691BFF9|nr:DUF2934 domain-containing protein [Burkholderia sp. 9120]